MASSKEKTTQRTCKKLSGPKSKKEKKVSYHRQPGDMDLRNWQAAIDQLFPKGIKSPLFDQLLTVKLYNYQKEGVLFAARAGRCLIADEMGLGKTIQAIATAELYRREFGVTKILIVCPTSLKYQWKSEIERFTDAKVHVVEGSIMARVWRMGQKNTVQVINLVSAGTIEHRMLGILKFKDSMAKGVLDDGQDVIFMEKTRFNEFMGKMQDLTGGQWVSDTEQQSTLEDEKAEMAPQPVTDDAPEPAKEKTAVPIPGDDDVPAPRPQEPGRTPAKGGKTPSTPEELVQTGVSFLSGLADTLSSPEKTKELVHSLTAKDEQTGQTYLKIPVENEESVSNALQVLGGLFKAFGK